MNPVEVNVYSDASFVSRSGLRIGGWGCVVVRPGRKPFEASGRFKDDHPNSDLSELRAAANAIHRALMAGLIKPGDRVVVRCDNANAVQWIRGEPFKRRKTNRRPDFNEVASWIVTTAVERGFEVTAERVQGHQRADSDDPHAVHNRRADQLCGHVTATRKIRKSKARPHRKERERLKRLREARI